jgi:predicted RNA-binding Zn-ribbon protein involved in translation (DUF1610 family)
MMEHKISRDSRCRSDIHRYDASDWIKDAGTPIPERVCRDCAHYIPGKLEENCAPGPKSVRTVGPLWAACNKFTTKTNNTMETTTKPAPSAAQVKEMPATKVCKACGRELPAEAFGKHARSADGLQPICRECRSIREKGNPKYGRRKKDGTVSIPAAHAQEVKEYVEKKLAKVAPEVRRPSDLDRAVVNELMARESPVIVNPSVTEIPDHDLVKELRRRGYNVTASKIIEL